VKPVLTLFTDWYLFSRQACTSHHGPLIDASTLATTALKQQEVVNLFLPSHFLMDSHDHYTSLQANATDTKASLTATVINERICKSKVHVFSTYRTQYSSTSIPGCAQPSPCVSCSLHSCVERQQLLPDDVPSFWHWGISNEKAWRRIWLWRLGFKKRFRNLATP